MKKKIQLPYNFEPRQYQIDNVFKPFAAGKRRIFNVWHRRAGKDLAALHLMATQMFQRVGNYYYILPTYTQGRKIIMEGITSDGKRFLDAIPPKLRKRFNQQEMLIETVNGSTFRIIGSDDMDRVVGTAPVGIVYSEFALQDPYAFDLFRPVLRENNGWAIFTTTPRGRNHAHRLYSQVKEESQDPKSLWHTSLLTWKDTGGIITQADLDEELASGMEEEMIEQEYNCSWLVGEKGAFFAKQIEQAHQTGRITKVPFQPDIPVFTFWDLGHRDTNAIWFVQFGGKSINIPLYLEDNTEGIGYYAGLLKNVAEQHGIRYAEHWLPHDGGHHERGTGRTVADQLEEYINNNRVGGIVEIAERASIQYQTQQCRKILPRCYFDEENAKRGLECLESYTKLWDNKRKAFSEKEHHNWASHGAAAFRTLGMADLEEVTWGDGVKAIKQEPYDRGYIGQSTDDQTESDFNVFSSVR